MSVPKPREAWGQQSLQVFLFPVLGSGMPRKGQGANTGQQGISSQGCVLKLDPGAKELLRNDLAVVLGQCPPKVSRQDVLINLLEEAFEVISVNKDLQKSDQGN